MSNNNDKQGERGPPIFYEALSILDAMDRLLDASYAAWAWKYGQSKKNGKGKP